MSPFPVYGKVYASNGSTPFPNTKVILRNKTKKEEKSQITNSLGEYVFDLANFNSAYSSNDSLEFRAEIGSFFVSATDTVSGSSLTKNLTLSTTPIFKIIDYNLIKEEIISYLRRVISDPKSRLSEKTDSFVADGSTVKFDLTERSGKCVFYVKVDDTIKTEYTHYYVDYNDKSTVNNPSVLILTPPSNGNLVEIKYNYGTSSWIYPDYPKPNLTISDYPRIRVDIISSRTEELGLGSLYNITEFLVEITIFSETMNELETLTKEVREAIIRNKQNFNFFKLIVPNSIGPVIYPEIKGDKITQRSMDFMIKFKIEEVS